MTRLRRRKPLERLPMLILLGLLAGALGGLSIGMIQMRATSSATSTAK